MSGMPPGVDVEQLARAIAAYLDPDGLWTAEDCAAHVRRTPRYFSERIAKTPGFPKAIRLPRPDGKTGDPLWRRSAVVEWVSKLERGINPLGGRPRKALDD